MRFAALIIVGLFAAASPAISRGTAGSGSPPGTNSYVRFSAVLKPGARGEKSAGAILFNLRPQKGIHINLKPPLSLSFDSTARVSPSGKLEVPRMAKLPYLDPSKQIVQRFTIDAAMRSGPVTLKGILTYYYCSDAEGWCSRFRQPFSVTLPAPE